MAEQVEPTDEPRGVRLILRALRYRNYRLYFLGQGISLVGTWIQRIAMSWLVYDLTHSALWLGIIGFVSQLPTLLLGPVSGVFVDRWDLRRLLVVTQAVSMVQALILAILVLLHWIQVWEVMALGMLLGAVNAFDMPARQSLVVHMVERKEDLGNAIALNSAMFNSARLIGPSVAGILVAAVGEGMCFLINGLSYIAVLWALLAMTLNLSQPRAAAGRIRHQFREGAAYVFGFAPIRWILVLLALISLVGMPYQVLMPVIAKDILKGDAKTLGFLMAAAGAGALLGALCMAARRSVRGLWRWITAAPALFGVGLICFGQSQTLWLSMAMLVATGFFMITHMSSCNTMLQTIADDDKRGRVMSFYMMAFAGTAPFGSLLAGGVAQRLGAPLTISLCGVASILGAMFFATQVRSVRRAVQPIYERLGIVTPPPTPDVDSTGSH